MEEVIFDMYSEETSMCKGPEAGMGRHFSKSSKQHQPIDFRPKYWSVQGGMKWHSELQHEDLVPAPGSGLHDMLCGLAPFTSRLCGLVYG